jgi:cardiolipin synthase
MVESTLCTGGKAMFLTVEDAVRRAREEVLVSLFTLADDSIGGRFIEALSEAARRGVRVQVIVDGYGSQRSFARVKKVLSAAGVSVSVFRPFQRWLLYHPLAALCRIHARVLIVDRALVGLGSIVFKNEFGDRADLFLLLEPAETDTIVEIFERFKMLATRRHRPALAPTGRAIGNGLSLLVSGPDAESQEIHRWLLSACRSAGKRILIATPIFFPTRELLSELRAAARRGVDVRIVTPLRIQRRHDILRAVPLPELVAKSGVQWYGARTYFHSKFNIFDNRWTLGSANFDVISMKRNVELNVWAEGGPLLGELETFFSVLATSSSGIAAADAWPIARVMAPLFYRTAEFLSSVS